MSETPHLDQLTRDQAAAALRSVAAAWALPVTPTQLDALLNYGQLLLQWNSRINLTGASSLHDLVADHLPDAFAIASRLVALPASTAIDVGSGGGLPAIPLAILIPSLKLQLIEPIAKKTAFLRTAIRELGLPSRLTVHATRLEIFRADHPAPFDAAISRATFHPSDWLAAALPLVRPGGLAFALTTTAAVPHPDGFLPTASLRYARERRWLIEMTRTS